MLQAIGRATVVVDIEVKGRVKTITIKDMLHVPKLKANLLSVRHLVLKRLHVKFGHEGSFVLSCHTLLLPHNSIFSFFCISKVKFYFIRLVMC